jgi:hypothetical protein
VWSADDVDNPTGLHVISSTATGTFALTGVVLDQAGGTPVSGATVTLSSVCAGCSDLSATTNTTGAFAFIDVPASTPPTLAVAAAGFGSYTVSNFGASPDEEYATTVALTTAAQSYDESTQPADGTATAASASSGYASDGRVPPFITVAEFPQAADCSAQSSSYVTRRYSWRFYVLHTMQGEIGGDFGSANGGFFHQQASKAVAAAIQNYAWYARQHSNAAGGADIDNTTRYQCFMPHKIVRQAFHTWLEDVLDERIATSSNTIQQTFYKAGGYSCADSAHPANGDDLSQLGAKAREETCGVTDWRTLDNYYYTGSVTGGLVPPHPDMSHSWPASGGLRLDFPATVGTSHVGWTYSGARWDTANSRWVTIARTRWSNNTRTVPTSIVYHPPNNGSYYYEARACNPVGCSTWNRFSDLTIPATQP